MGLQHLLAWLSETPDAADHPELGNQLEKAGMRSMRERLERGEDISSRLEEMYVEAAAQLRPPYHPGDDLEKQVLNLSDHLDMWTLRTERYCALERRDPALLPQIRSELERLWKNYCDITIAPDQVTLETVVFHQLLKRGFEIWYQALGQAHKGDWEDALDLAAEGNRLLIAVAETQQQMVHLADNAGFDLELT